MTTLNAKANAAYHALIEQYERDNPGDMWVGFDNKRDAYEQGWEDGHEARPVPDREAVVRTLELYGIGHTALMPDLSRSVIADALLALLNGTDS